MDYQIYLSGMGNIYKPGDRTMEVIRPRLTMGLNEAGSFECSLPPSHKAYNKIEVFASTVDIVENGSVIWTGRCIETETRLNQERTFRFEGALAFLNDVVLPYKEYKETTIKDFIESIVSRYNNAVTNKMRRFSIDRLDIAENDTIWRKTDYETAWDILQDMVLDSEGGYVLLSKSQPGNHPVKLTYISDFCDYGNQSVKFASNIVDMTHGLNAENIVTDIVPICHYSDEVYTLKGLEKSYNKYKNRLNSSYNTRPNSNGIIVNHKLRNKYTRVEKVVEYDMLENLNSVTSLEEKESEGRLTQDERVKLANARSENADIILKTKKYMYRNALKKAKALEYATFSVKVQAADLRDLSPKGVDDPTDNFKLGDLVTLSSPPHGLDRSNHLSENDDSDLDRQQLPITNIEIDLTSGVKALTLGFPRAKELTKILAPKKNTSRTSWKKDGNKHVTQRASAKSGSGSDETVPLIKFTRTYEGTTGQKYHINDTLDLIDYEVHLVTVDGDIGPDVTQDCTFTIDDASAEGYKFLSSDGKTLVAHYLYTEQGGSEPQEITCTTPLNVVSAYIARIVFTTWPDKKYEMGEQFDLSAYTVRAEYDDKTRIVLDNNDPDLSFNIQNNAVISSTTPNKLVATFCGDRSGNRERTDSIDIIFANGVNDQQLAPGQEDSYGYSLAFVSVATGKVWKPGEKFLLNPPGFNPYRVHLFFRDPSVPGSTKQDFGDVTYSTQLRWNIHGKSKVVGGIDFTSKSPEDYYFEGEGFDPSTLTAYYNRGDHEISAETPLTVGNGVNDPDTVMPWEEDPYGRRLWFSTVPPAGFSFLPGQNFKFTNGGQPLYVVSFKDINGDITDVTMLYKTNPEKSWYNIHGNSDVRGGVDLTNYDPTALIIDSDPAKNPDEVLITYIDTATINGTEKTTTFVARATIPIEYKTGQASKDNFKLEFTRTRGRAWTLNEQFDLTYYEVTVRNTENPDTYPARVVTMDCTYNIGMQEKRTGGVVTVNEDFSAYGASKYRFSEENMPFPEQLVATYDLTKFGEGFSGTISAATPLLFDKRDDPGFGERTDLDGVTFWIEFTKATSKIFRVYDKISPLENYYQVTLKSSDPTNFPYQDITTAFRTSDSQDSGYIVYNIGRAEVRQGGVVTQGSDWNPEHYVIRGDGSDPKTLSATYYLKRNNGSIVALKTAPVPLYIEGNSVFKTNTTDTKGFLLKFTVTPGSAFKWNVGDKFSFYSPSTGTKFYKVTLFRNGQVVKDDVTEDFDHIHYNITADNVRTGGVLRGGGVNPNNTHTITTGEPTYLIATYDTTDDGGDGEISCQTPFIVAGRDSLNFNEPDSDGYSIRFTTATDHIFGPGDRINPLTSYYTVGLFNGDSLVKDITTLFKSSDGQTSDYIRYNVGSKETTTGGITTPSDGNPNNYTIDGRGGDPEDILAFYYLRKSASGGDDSQTDRIVELKAAAPLHVNAASNLNPADGTSSTGYKIRFTKQPGSAFYWRLGEHFDLSMYEVTLSNNGSDLKVVTAACTYNIGGVGARIGGITFPGSNNPNDYVFDGFAPKNLYATYDLSKEGDTGGEISCSCPLRLEMRDVVKIGDADASGRSLKFTKVWSGIWRKGHRFGDHFDAFELTYYDEDGNSHIVTRDWDHVRYNIKTPGNTIGGVTVGGSVDPSGYVFTGYDPDELVGYYTVTEADGSTHDLAARHEWALESKTSSAYGPGERDPLGRYLAFTSTYAGTWEMGQTFSLAAYTVTFFDGQGGSKSVTRECTFNIGVDEVVIGGARISDADYSYDGANKHVIDGREPQALRATYITEDGTEFWDEAPLRTWVIHPYYDGECRIALGAYHQDNSVALCQTAWWEAESGSSRLGRYTQPYIIQERDGYLGPHNWLTVFKIDNPSGAYDLITTSGNILDLAGYKNQQLPYYIGVADPSLIVPLTLSESDSQKLLLALFNAADHDERDDAYTQMSYGPPYYTLEDIWYGRTVPYIERYLEFMEIYGDTLLGRKLFDSYQGSQTVYLYEKDSEVRLRVYADFGDSSRSLFILVHHTPMCDRNNRYSWVRDDDAQPDDPFRNRIIKSEPICRTIPWSGYLVKVT